MSSNYSRRDETNNTQHVQLASILNKFKFFEKSQNPKVGFFEKFLRRQITLVETIPMMPNISDLDQ